MYKKSKFIKTIILTLVFGVIFFGIGIGFAKNYPIYATSNDCGQIPNFSTDSNNGASYATNPANPLLRYANNMTAINRAAANKSNQTVCNDFALEGGQARLDWKKQICNQPIMDPLVQYQIHLFDYYNQNILTGKYGRGFTSKEKVWNLQAMMEKAKCHKHKDCKLGVITISDFLFCNVCEAINGNWKETTSIDTSNCIDGYTPVDGVACCQPECTTSIETSVDMMDGYPVGEDITVTVIFEIDDDIKNFSTESFVVEGGDIKSDTISCDKVEKQCIFDITPIGTGDIEIKSLLGTAISNGGAKCKENISTVYFMEENEDGEDLECIPPELKILSGKNDCTESYGSTYYTEDNGCCKQCDDGKIYTGSSCKCEVEIGGCPAGQKPENCKCVCDPATACCGIELNTVVPFIGDCIEMTTQNNTHTSNGDNTSNVNQLNAFPFLMMGLSKILVTVILIFSFLTVIVAGLMMVTGAFDGEMDRHADGIKAIKRIISALILLGTSGLILKLINPSFFGG